ncbi:winged helix-turn-helix transcriptional regulator [Anoxybacillus sp. CHMUD]|uniref:winged helix-turn-helix transcriptional regulator n=1 Tax=Anoxybacillus sp. CHMUD TaxID=2508870 RepID=UPI00149155E0|nr:winged helix-turn-helix transcriptional regulator [Anoxybacillus sp. CHMUD]
MTREEKRKIRLQIIRLLDRCDECKHRTELGASITVCKVCPIGKKMVEISSKFENIPKQLEYLDGKPLRTPWEETEEQFIIENHDKMSYKEIAAELGRAPTSVQSKIKKMRRAGLVPRVTTKV